MQNNASASEQRLHIRPTGNQRLRGGCQGLRVIVSIGIFYGKKGGTNAFLGAKNPPRAREQDPAFMHAVSATLTLKERWPNTKHPTPGDGKIKNIQQLESRLCAIKLKEFILLGVAKGQQREDLVGIRGTLALRDGWRSSTGSGGFQAEGRETWPWNKTHVTGGGDNIPPGMVKNELRP